jgi:hypothetical protein
VDTAGFPSKRHLLPCGLGPRWLRLRGRSGRPLGHGRGWVLASFSVERGLPWAGLVSSVGRSGRRARRA